MVVGVTFTITLKVQKDVDAFLEGFARLQEYTNRHEPGTLLYELHQDVSNPMKFIVMERYNHMDDVENVHSKSEAFNTFLNGIVPSLDSAEHSLCVMSTEAVEAKLTELRRSLGEKVVFDTFSAPKKGVLVFCGARVGASPAYVEEAKKAGSGIARRGLPVVYGGGTHGIMGTVAQAAKEVEGGQVIAVIPTPLKPREASGDMIGDRVYYTSTMSERKSIMFAHADVVIALPGGIGTFDELLEALTLFQLNCYRPKIGLVNVNGYFDGFMAYLRHMVAEGFLEEKMLSVLVVRSTSEEVLSELLDNSTPPMASHMQLQWNVRP